MPSSLIQKNAEKLNSALSSLRALLEFRLTHHFSGSSEECPPLTSALSKEALQALTSIFPDRELSFEEAVALTVAIVPHVRPHFFDAVISNMLSNAGDFPQLGGVRGQDFRGFMPTGETVLFLLAGDDLNLRFYYQRLFSSEHFFSREKILSLSASNSGEPKTSGRLMLSNEIIDLLTLGTVSEPSFGTDFPASRITTEMDWEDLVLNPSTIRQISELETWLHHGHTLLYKWGMKKRVRPGYRALFYGLPGTGKTLTASLLGKHTGRSMYRIDLSLVVSKFIGETEKNLASVFDRAENKDWILFFDEADALFGKRTGIRDAHDKYANQEVSYLLQRVESFSGLVILATNFKNNIDEAFLRRFQSVVHFPKPGVEQRLKIWQHMLPEQLQFSDKVDLNLISQKHELTGSNITNIVQYCALRSLDRGDNEIQLEDIQTAIEREYQKVGKVL